MQHATSKYFNAHAPVHVPVHVHVHVRLPVHVHVHFHAPATLTYGPWNGKGKFSKWISDRSDIGIRNSIQQNFL
jgi:hypothetical protein